MDIDVIQPVSNKRLLLRPRPYEFESWQGYLIRVTEMNRLDSPRILLGTFTNRQELKRALMLSDREVKRLRGLVPTNYHENEVSTARETYGFNISSYRWCPECLLNHEFHHELWGLRFYGVCIKHRIRMHDTCPRCKSLQLFNRNRLLACQFCGGSLLHSERVQEHDRVILLQKKIVDVYRGYTLGTEFELTFQQINRMIQYLGQFNGEAMPAKPGKITGLNHLSQVVPLMRTTAQLLSNWPSLMYELIAKIQSKSTVTLSIKRHFGSLYSVLYHHLRDKEFQFLRDAFEDYLFQYWPSLINQRNKAFHKIKTVPSSRVTIKQMAEMTGADASLINHLIKIEHITAETVVLESGRHVSLLHRDLVSKLQEIAKEVVTLGEAAATLGISDTRVLDLIESKIVLLVSQRIKTSTKWLIRKDSLNRLCFECLPKKDSCIPIKQILQHWKLTTAEFTALVNGLRYRTTAKYSEADEAVFLGELWLDPEEISRWLESYRRIFLSDFSVDQAARHLGVKQEVAYHLVKHGMLQSDKDLDGSLRVRFDAIQAFQIKYIALAEIASKMNTSTKHAMKIITQTPVCGPTIDGCRQYFYLR